MREKSKLGAPQVALHLHIKTDDMAVTKNDAFARAD